MESSSQNKGINAKLAGYIGSLSQREQTIIALHYLEELSWSEMASVIGLAEEVISEMHNGAMRKLQILMMRQGNGSTALA